MKVNRTQLSEVFGVSLPTIDSWVRAGCPVEQRGGRGVEWKFETADVAKWRQDRAVNDATGDKREDADEIDRRTNVAKMRQAELAVARDLKLVAPVEEFERVSAARAAMVRQNVMNVAQRACLRLLGEKSEEVFKRVMREELTLALRTAYETALELPEEDEEGAEG